MEQKPTAFAPEAATDEPASPATPASPASPDDRPVPAEAGEERDPLGHPVFPTEEEDCAYWRGLTAGLRMAEAPPALSAEAAPFVSRRVRRARYDGLTPARQAVVLEELAAGATVAAAARAAGVSTTALYNLRNRREGRAFDIAWEAAIRRGRKVLADLYRDRSIEGQTVTRYDKDGNVAGSRHFIDNRLAMAVLTRLDNKLNAYRDDERLVTAVAEEFEELLDVIEEGGDAEAFIEALRPPRVDDPVDDEAADAAFIARYHELRRFDGVDPATIGTSDLDPKEMGGWTDDQWQRADASGFLDALPDEEWPEEGKGRADGEDGGEGAEPERDDG